MKRNHFLEKHLLLSFERHATAHMSSDEIYLAATNVGVIDSMEIEHHTALLSDCGYIAPTVVPGGHRLTAQGYERIEQIRGETSA